MKTSVRSLTVVGAFAFLAACSGGGGGSVPSVGQPSGQSGPAALKIFVPSALTAGMRRANALPSTTQSVQINVTSGTSTPLATPIAPFVFNVSATATGCSSVAGGIACTETVTVPFGSLAFAITAYAGQNASGAAIALGNSTATIGSGSNNVSVTMNAVNIYTGSGLEGGMGSVVINHTANTYTDSGNGGSGANSGTVTTLPNGDLKLVETNPAAGDVPNSITYARELPGSIIIFGSTNSATVQPTGGVTTGGDMGAGVASQGCPTSPSSVIVSAADVAGPAWSASSPSTSPAYVSGTAATTIASGVATINFTGNDYSVIPSVAAIKAETGSQTCSGGIFTAANQGSVAISPDNFFVVTNGANGTPQLTDVHEGSFGTAASGTVNTTAVLAQTYDGFVGQMTNQNNQIVKAQSPYQLAPSSGSSMLACQYSNFEAGTVGTNCATITFGAQTAQPGVVLVTATIPNQPTAQGAIVVGQSSSGKYVLFGNVGGSTVFFIQH